MRDLTGVKQPDLTLGMALVHCGAITCCLRVGLAHVGSFLSVAVIVGAREVIDAGTCIDPNDSVGWTT
jgi:hypothetical protein